MTKQTTTRNIVFYADDDQDDLELVQDAFARYSKNVEVITAKDGSQALKWLQSLGTNDPKPCLIILDVNMPLYNGKEVLKEIRTMKHLEEVPVVLFTTSSMPHDQAFAEKLKAGFITKPIDVSQMELITELFIDHGTDEIRKKIRRQFR